MNYFESICAFFNKTFRAIFAGNKPGVYFILFYVLILFSCSKETIEPRSQDHEPPFHSAFYDSLLASEHNANRRASVLSMTPYKHFINVTRGGEFWHHDSILTKSLFFTSREWDSGLTLKVSTTTLRAADEYYIFYPFSNSEIRTLINGVSTDSLPEKDFNKIPYELDINDSKYNGVFPEPGDLKDELIPTGLTIISDRELTIYWAPPKFPGGIATISINPTTPGGNNKRKFYTVEDNGTHTFPKSELEEYPSGSVLSIAISRNIYTANGDFLIRSTAIRNWIARVR